MRDGRDVNNEPDATEGLSVNDKQTTPFAVLFDGSFDGFLCVVYAFYYHKIRPLYIQTEDAYQQVLDMEEYYAATDVEKAARVMTGIQQKISPDAAHYLYNAFLADETDKHSQKHSDKYMDMFHYVVLGFKVGAPVDNYLQVDFVLRVHKMARYVRHEAHLLSGFCRFSETKQGVYYCEITPKNMVLPILAEHFRSRFMDHSWIIHDTKHGVAAVYDSHDYVITPVPKNAKDVTLDFADDETLMQDLWVTFFTTIAIDERKSYKRQRQHIPLYFRGPMTEFQKNLLRG